MKGKFREILETLYVIFASAFVIFALASIIYVYFFFEKLVGYPRGSWNRDSSEIIFNPVGEDPSLVSSADFSYDLPLEKFPNNYDEVLQNVINRETTQDEKVLLLRYGQFITSSDELNLRSSFEKLSSSDLPIFINKDIIVADFLIRYKELVTIYREHIDEKREALFTSVSSALVDLEDILQTDEAKLVIAETADKLKLIDDSQNFSSLSNTQLSFLAWAVKNSSLMNEWEFIRSENLFLYDDYKLPDLSRIDEYLQNLNYEVTEESLLQNSENFDFSNYVLGLENPCLDSLTSLETAAALGSEYAQALSSEILPCTVDPDDIQSLNNLDLWMLSSIVGDKASSFPAYETDSWKNKDLNSSLVSIATFDTVNELKDNSSAGSSVNIQNDIYLDQSYPLYAKLHSVALFWDNLIEDDNSSPELAGKVQSLVSDLETLQNTNKGEMDNSTFSTLLSNMSDRIDSVDLGFEIGFRIVTVSDGNSLKLAVGPELRYLENNQPPEWLTDVVNDDNFNEPYDIEPTEQAIGTVRIPSLMYHHIDDYEGTSATKRFYVSPETFEKQLAYLVAMNYKSLSIDEFYDLLKSGENPKQKSIVLTFDDGPADNYINAYPLLKKYGLVGVFYIMSDRRAISNQNLKDMIDNQMFVDSHSASHIDLKKEEDTERLWYEINTSKYTLQNVTGHEVKSFAYPGCVAGETAFDYVASTGYKIAFSCGSTIDNRFAHRLSLSRMHVYDNMDNFKKILSGYFELPEVY